MGLCCKWHTIVEYMQKECKNCGEMFIKKDINESKKYFSARPFCSRYCKDKFPISDETRQKMRDAAKLKIKEWSPERKQRNKEKTLSRRPLIICRQCSKEFRVKEYRRFTAFFCSHKCSTDFRNHGISTENEKVRRCAEYKKWRKSIFEIDNFTCRECGKRGGTLNADHIKPFAIFKELRFDINNGQTLCESCHKKTETFGRRKMYRELNLA